MVIEAATGLAPPLCVDLDRTLIRGDLLLESLVLLVKRNPLYLLLIPFWLLRGKAALEARVLRQVTLNPEALPYNPGLIEWLQRERANGRSVWLVTASHEKLADRVAAHLGFFEGVLASNERSNLAAATKAAQLVNRFGERGFDYCGNEDIQALYRQPKVIWALCILLLYWVSRIWLTAQRGQMHDDPVVYALRDRESLAVGLIAVVTIALAV